jgi:glycosyltransferase involved in cell wall biosynthesis/peptidoglycan/xylan/chitin deacetylase (PgdA/CDA1 family)
MPTQQPLVSVVIATYNSGIYLQEAIDSILGQSFRDLELLVVDDGSTDDTRALVDAVSDDRLQYVWQPNAGQTAAKNNGVRRARGEFIGFCDGDDYWYPNKLELQLALFAQSAQTGVVYSPADTIDEFGNKRDEILPAEYRGDVTAELFMRNFVSFGTALVRRRCIEQLGAFDDSLAMGIDWDLWLRISARYHFDYVPVSTYAYRIWSGQMSKNWRGRYSSAFRIMRKFVRDNPHAISWNLKRRGFANTYSNRARARMHEHPLQAVQDGALGLMLDPFERYSWKTLGFVAVNAVGGAREPSAFTRTPGRFRLLKKSLAPLVRTKTSDEPRVFMYHRFAATPTRRALSAAEFRKQMTVLKQRCEIVTLSELVDRKSRGIAERPLAAVTVDDGYADFYRIAFPILRELNIPATVFVTTGFIDRKLFLWPDQIRALLDKAGAGSFRITGVWSDTQVVLGTSAQREAAWNQLADQLVFATQEVRMQAVQDLSRSLGVSLSETDMLPYEAMTWTQLKELVEAGIEVGDHTYAHACLTAMSQEEARRELTKSKELLERNLRTVIRSFAFPNGTRRDCNKELIGLLEQLGYESAVLAIPAPVSSEHPFEIGRFSAICSLDQFSALVSGFGALRRT